MKLKIQIKFCFTDFKEDIETINLLLGLTPDFTTLIGEEYEMRSGEIRKWKENSWGLKSDYIDIEFEDAFNEFIKRILPFKSKFIEFSKNNISSFIVYYTAYEIGFREFYMEKQFIKFMSDLNAEFEFTIYDFSGED